MFSAHQQLQRQPGFSPLITLFCTHLSSFMFTAFFAPPALERMQDPSYGMTAVDHDVPFESPFCREIKGWVKVGQQHAHSKANPDHPPEAAEDPRALLCCLAGVPSCSQKRRRLRPEAITSPLTLRQYRCFCCSLHSDVAPAGLLGSRRAAVR